MKKSVLAIVLSASLVLAGASAVSAAPVDKVVVAACVKAAKEARVAADNVARDAFKAVLSTGDKAAKKVAKKTFDAAKKANVKALGVAIKACKPAKK